MDREWLEMSIELPAALVETVSQALMEVGCTGVTVAEAVLDTFEMPDPDELETPPSVRAYFPVGEVALLQDAVRGVLAGINPQLAGQPLPCRLLADEDWASGWQQHFPPLRVGRRLLIRPSWDDTPGEGAECVLTLDPGRAFGTGTHATTGLCLEAIARLFAGAAPPRRVLDVGAGSGILAMAAAALGAERVVACEIDAEACQVAVENIAANGLQELISTTTRPLEELDGRFDLVLANILAGENIRLAPHFLAHLAPGGWLALSGILVEQESAVVAAYAPLPLTLAGIERRDEWACLLYRAAGGPAAD